MFEIQEQEIKKNFVSISKWVEKAKSDPNKYLERSVTEVILTTIGRIYPYKDHLYLKGGILMAVLYNSPRNTSDIDYTANAKPNPEYAYDLQNKLNEQFPSVCADLGYPYLRCNAQSYKLRPKGKGFANFQAPAIEMKIGYVKRGTPGESKFEKNMSSDVISIDISFNEPISNIQIIYNENSSVKAYSLIDLISEKLRSLLQQLNRNRRRRQDLYDLYSLIKFFHFDDEEMYKILNVFKKKCEERDIKPTSNSFDNEKLIEVSKIEWETLSVENEELPDFEDCFNEVKLFYKKLPWEGMCSYKKD